MFLGSWSVLEDGMRDVGNENASGKSGTSIYIYINQYIQIKDLYNRILPFSEEYGSSWPWRSLG